MKVRYRIVLVAGLSSPGQSVLSLLATLAHPRLSMVSMIAPSPDWFIGVSALELLAPGPGGDWVDELVVDLFAYDAGSDSGGIYTSANSDTVPAVTISLITSSPFDGAVPLGTFTIVRTDDPAQQVPGLSSWGVSILLGSLLCGALVARRLRRCEG